MIKCIDVQTPILIQTCVFLSKVPVIVIQLVFIIGAENSMNIGIDKKYI